MDSANVDADYDRLVGLIYRGALETQPWQSALPALRDALDAQVASLVLRPPSRDDRGVILNCVRPDAQGQGAEVHLADPDDWEVTVYREQFFTLDPFVNLPLDKVIALEDILPDPELRASDYYLHYLQPINLFQILGVDTAEPGGMLARLRFSRRENEPRFDAQERHLLEMITPPPATGH
jgi:GAF domain-containing protein